MAEEVGGIVYEVGMDVKGLKAGAATANKTLDDLESSTNKTTSALGKLDKNARNAGSGMKNAGGAASGLKTSMSMLAGAISVSLIIEWGKRFLEVADNMTQLQARISRLSNDAKTANETFSSLANIASTTGASLSDTTKLWETLTSSLKEAGATNAQVLNLTDTLQKIGRIGGSSTEEMANALRQFGQSIASGTIRAEEFNSILEQMPELARQIAAGLGISMGELRARMLDGKLTAEDALNAIQDRTSVVNAEFAKLPRSISQATGSLETSFAKMIASINDATGASSTFVSVIDSITSAINRLTGQTVSAAEVISDLTSTAEMFSRRARTWSWVGIDGWAAQNQAIAAVANQAATLVSDMDAVTKSTGEAAKAQAHLTVPKAAEKDKKGKGKGKSAEERQAESVAEKLEKLRQQTMLNATSTSELSREQAILNAQQSLGKAATQEQIKLAGEYAAKIWDQKNALKEQAEAEKEKQRVEKSYQGLRAIASPTTGIDSEYQQRMADLDAYAAAYPQKITEIEQTRAAIEAQYRQQRIDAMWQEWSQQNVATQAASAAFDAFGQTAGNALTGILTGSMSVSDALRSIGSNILSSVINAFVQMGIQWAQSVIMGQAGMAAASAATIAQAAAISAAMAPAAAMTSLATAGTNSAPAMAGMSATVGLAKTLSIAGALKNGGPAQEGSMYRVGENNLPEIFQASNGHQYMIPGDSGRVISNKDITGGGSGVVVYNNVINNSSAQVSSSARDNGDGSVTIETIVSDISENGPIGQAISRNYNTNRRATE
ncbi:tape measure protein [Salmonella enterica subsp. enterica serovar Reading]|nr:tape measure protein [Salmonella enterica subsp. enterica serovar Reading]MCP0078087.1 tape measure protein [Salmonella enterica subsp. enterica serovar Reading]MCP0094659.1 tape measure protein [Salmonella enterica subsp. enterica serovar Reading]MCP0424846.1 tape measure protein [Salmonella enterica subsp. enterica serovar Reading]MCR3079915.1 tape measure protein [Salmonella enterica subsp. enterica serovar Reading]